MIEIITKNERNYQFCVKSHSGEVLFTSKIFDDKNEIQQNLKEFKHNTNERQIERKTMPNGKFQFKFKSTQGKILGTSNPYLSEAGMENGIKNFKEALQKA
ncbi:YegP family protein [Croceivirga sp. JEA036]|uniref:YegP family protein n=1 Tax=Croceivirga sp. JEA036 TaxID=2721162 RepID=UPI001439842F|nr:YegP family protein [Croceivirga sp. JEA036]NJB35496.1 YegP family protein [Croceivirga sp. JEA036]